MPVFRGRLSKSMAEFAVKSAANLRGFKFRDLSRVYTLKEAFLLSEGLYAGAHQAGSGCRAPSRLAIDLLQQKTLLLGAVGGVCFLCSRIL